MAISVRDAKHHRFLRRLWLVIITAALMMMTGNKKNSKSILFVQGFSVTRTRHRAMVAVSQRPKTGSLLWATTTSTPQTPQNFTTDNNSNQQNTNSNNKVTTSLRSNTTPPTKRGQTAIVLNTNARSVTPRVVETAVATLGESNVYVTTSAAQAQAAARDIWQQGYSLVIPVGGDGTLSSLVNLMCNVIRQENENETMTLEQAMAKLPVMAYLPLGTGNGVGSVVGNPVKSPRRGILPGTRKRRQRHLRQTLERLQAIGRQLPNNDDANLVALDTDEYESIQMPMMEVTTFQDNRDEASSSSTGDLCFFAGVGFDSLMLNDFKRIKAWSIRTGVLTRFLSSVAGYCVALVVRTLPQTVLEGRHNIHVQLTTPHVNSTLWVDHRRGDVVRPVTQAQLYQGVTGILAAGTSPFYGGGLRLFPFARLTTDQMHLRVGRIHPLTGFFNMPQIFAGTYRDKSDRLGCLDFIGDEFEVQVSPNGTPSSDSSSSTASSKGSGDENNDNETDETKGYPFQHSGESMGHVERFRLRVVKEPVRFICLKAKSRD